MPLRRFRLAALTLAFIVALSFGTGSAHGDTTGNTSSSCDAVLEPVYAFYAPPSEPGSSTGVQPTRASSLNVSPPPVDTDGDGAPDTVEFPDAPSSFDSLTIRRGDGDVVLTARGGQMGYPTSIGDLNNDGRTDLSIGATGSPSSQVITRTVVIAQPLPPGRYDIFDVGITMPAGPSAAIVGVGDQNADGFDDVGMTSDLSDGPVLSIASGPDLIEPGPGGTLAALPASIVPLHGPLVAIVTLHDTGAPALVESPSPGATTMASGSPVLLVHDGPNVKELTITMPVVPIDSGPGINQVVTGFLSTDGHHIIDLNAQSRSGTSRSDWDLDTPCLTDLTDDAHNDGQPTPTTDLARTGSGLVAQVEFGTALLLVGIGLTTLTASRRQSRPDPT